ncbi:acetoacetate decarboxylase family protein [Lentzea jiangxiensis]|uniref:Acetoacetate decarboxylase (ADC) n=1 Tax=Lentzea jiangxiensis TaxID=641025 RepID=A0A1H0X3K2_9PSEU|nr:acetoacetate decarboxylase family protein [Lentzea jiangxiensis]SDP97537.1 Acetoacetate decarboxylase (ADC) [Lentzea jiangxiensis]
MSTNYPEPPWRLNGQSYAGIYRFPAALMPRLPAGVVPITLAGHAIAAVMWVDYQRGSVLEYREFLVGVLCRAGRKACLTTVSIWVDDHRSRVGGRALWGIPKEMAKFSFRHGKHAELEMSLGEAGRVTGSFRSGPTLPFSTGLTVRLVQDLNGRYRFTKLRSRCRLTFGRATLVPDVPELGFLAQGRAIAHVGLRDFSALFDV